MQIFERFFKTGLLGWTLAALLTGVCCMPSASRVG
jgi:hypothetical protein